jgi:hypothetical protein
VKPLVSVMASLQNSVPVQAMAPRQKGEPSTWRPIWPSSRTSSAVLLLGMSMKSRFCETVVRREPLPKRSARSAAASKLLAGQAAAQDGGADVAEAGLRCG